MSDAMQSHLERFPEGAIEVAQGRILDFNRAAQAQFPELAVGMEAPEFLSGSLSDPEGAGTFAHNGSLYLFSRVSGAERDLLLFRPAPQSPLTQGQLDGFVRQMRGFLQDILLEFETVSGPSRGGIDAFSKSFCRVYRLLSNLDFLRSAGAPEGVPFRPVTMDLAGLCRSLTQEAAFLLGESGKVTSSGDFVFYGNLKHSSGAVEHLGDNLTGEGAGDDEQIRIDLTKVPDNIQRIAFTVTIYEAESRRQNFGMVNNAFIRIFDETNGQELLRYDLGEDFSIETAAVFGEVYKNNGEWKFNAIGSGYQGGLAALCANYGVDVE